MKNENDFIATLVDDYKPKPILKHPAIMMLPVSIAIFCYVIAISLFFDVRADASFLLSTDNVFLVETIYAILTAIVAIFSLGWLSIPDTRGTKIPYVATMSMASIFILWMMYRLITEGMGYVGAGHMDGCAYKALIIAIVPSFISAYIVRKGYTTKPYISSLTLAIAFSMIGWLSLRFTCAIDSIGHAYILHFLPFVIIGFVLGIFSRKIFQSK